MYKILRYFQRKRLQIYLVFCTFLTQYICIFVQATFLANKYLHCYTYSIIDQRLIFKPDIECGQIFVSAIQNIKIGMAQHIILCSVGYNLDLIETSIFYPVIQHIATQKKRLKVKSIQMLIGVFRSNLSKFLSQKRKTNFCFLQNQNKN